MIELLLDDEESKVAQEALQAKKISATAHPYIANGTAYIAISLFEGALRTALRLTHPVTAVEGYDVSLAEALFEAECIIARVHGGSIDAVFPVTLDSDILQWIWAVDEFEVLEGPPEGK